MRPGFSPFYKKVTLLLVLLFSLLINPSSVTGIPYNKGFNVVLDDFVSDAVSGYDGDYYVYFPNDIIETNYSQFTTIWLETENATFSPWVNAGLSYYTDIDVAVSDQTCENHQSSVPWLDLYLIDGQKLFNQSQANAPNSLKVALQTHTPVFKPYISAQEELTDGDEVTFVLKVGYPQTNLQFFNSTNTFHINNSLTIVDIVINDTVSLPSYHTVTVDFSTQRIFGRGVYGALFDADTQEIVATDKNLDPDNPTTLTFFNNSTETHDIQLFLLNQYTEIEKDVTVSTKIIVGGSESTPPQIYDVSYTCPYTNLQEFPAIETTTPISENTDPNTTTPVVDTTTTIPIVPVPTTSEGGASTASALFGVLTVLIISLKKKYQ